MLSTGVSGSLFPGKTWVGGAAPACPRARAWHRGGNAGLGQSCRLGTKGLRACGRPAPASPGPPPAPNEQWTRGAGLSPAPARGDLIWDTATGPGAPALLCPHPTAGPPAQAPGVSMGTPKLLLARGPQSRCWHSPAPGPQPCCGSPRSSPIPAPTRGGCLHPPCPHPQATTAAQLSHVHPSTRLPCSPSGTLCRAMGPCAHPRASPPCSRPPPGGQRGQAAFVREGKRWRMLSGKGGQRQQHRSPAQRLPAPLTPPSPRSAPGVRAGLGCRGGSAPPRPGAYRLLGAVAARLPRVRVVAELDLVGGHPVVPARGRGSRGPPAPSPGASPAPRLTSRWS